MAVWMSSSDASNTKAPSLSSTATRSSAASTAPASEGVSNPPRNRPRTWAREPVMSSRAKRRSNGSDTVNAHSSAAGPPSNRPCQRVIESLSRQLAQLGGQLGSAQSLGGHAQQRVVTGHGAKETGDATPVEGGGHHMGTTGRRAYHHQIAGVRHVGHPFS